MFAMQYRKMGAKIAYYRKIKGLKQVELAENIGISTSYLSKIERGFGTLGVPLSTYMRIAQALDVKVQDLISD